MIKFDRGEAPKCLSYKNNKGISNSEKWGKSWAAKVKKKKSNARFQWHQFEGDKVDHLIIEQLRILSNSHCAFCDKHAPENDSDSIEHFYPKTLYPNKAYDWVNLFLCCGGCQKAPKGWKKYESTKRYLILNPCDKDYAFERYFTFNALNGEISINHWNDSDKDKECAKITIFYFQLNEFDRPKVRLDNFKKFYDPNSPNHIKEQFNLAVDELPYRFIYL